MVKNEKQLHSVLDNILEGAQIVGPDWRYLYVNKAAAEQGQSPQEKLIGHTMMEVYPGIEQTGIFKILQLCMKDGEARQMVNEFSFPDRSSGFFEIRIDRIPQGLFILSIDITKRVIAERKLEKQNVKLTSSNRELEQFAYIASHDLQEPLRTASSFVDLFIKEYGNDLDEKGHLFLEQIKSSTGRMRNLIHGLLEYSRLGRDKNWQLVDCNELVRDVLQDLDVLVKESRAQIKVSSLPCKLNAFPIELKSLFQNLLTNAMKFKRKDIDPIIEISSIDEGSHWRFAISDNGIGIEQKYFNRIFVIFQRLHLRKEYGGTGIGLAYCKKIAELHSGKIWVESVLGKGSTFFFTALKSQHYEL